MTPGGHRGLRGLGPGASAGSWTPTSGSAPLEGPDVGVHRSDEVRTVMCSYIAVRLRQPASTPAMFRDRIVNRSWRTTHLFLGSGHVLENLGQGLA